MAEPFDKWAVAANSHLMAYLRAKGNPKRYHPDPSPRGAPGPEGTVRTLLLVEQKNLWADEMRESAEGGAVDPQPQRATWELRMGYAEAAIDRRIAGEDVRPMERSSVTFTSDRYAERVDLDL